MLAAARVAGGLVALLAKIIIVPLFVALTGVPQDTQEGYAAGTSGGALFPVLMALPITRGSVTVPSVRCSAPPRR